MALNHVIESQQFDVRTLSDVFEKAEEFRKTPSSRLKNVLSGMTLAAIFYEPSTRTRLSFESAMQKLGGNVLSTENAKEFSSAVKGESIEDSVRVIGGYVDCIVMRHFEDGAAKRAAAVSKVPVINAGDGRGQHPTQALLDVYTIYKELGRLNDFEIAMVGDLSCGRTVRSLCYLLAKFKNVHITFISPSHLKMREDIKEYLTEKGIQFRESDNLNAALGEADIIYMTRIQKERMTIEDYEKAKGKFVINQDNFHLVKHGARILHPLPKVDEIDLPIEIEEKDPRIAYFRQAENGLYVRMALLSMLLEKKSF